MVYILIICIATIMWTKWRFAVQKNTGTGMRNITNFKHQYFGNIFPSFGFVIYSICNENEIVLFTLDISWLFVFNLKNRIGGIVGIKYFCDERPREEIFDLFLKSLSFTSKVLPHLFNKFLLQTLCQK